MFNFTWPSFGDIIQNLSHIATIIGVFAAVTAGGFAVKNHNENIAMNLYSGYLERAFDNPDLASPAQYGAGMKDDVKYQWYISNMLVSLERIMMMYPNSPEWRKVVFAQICYHRGYFKDNQVFHKYELKTYSSGIQGYILAATDQSCI